MSISEKNSLERKPISFLDFPELIGTANHGVFVTAKEISETFNLYIERSFSEQLGMYSFVGFEFDGHYFGCRSYDGSPKKLGVMVSVLEAKVTEEAGLIARALNLTLSEVHDCGGEW